MDVNKRISQFLEMLASDIVNQERVAVAVSGGGDSMALAYAVFKAFPEVEIHFLTVDHGLRSEASQEALNVKEWVSEWGIHETLLWKHDGVESKVQESAREARYALMQSYCAEHDIQALFIGHHRDDLIETFLMRLTSGSGLDGLASISPVAQRGGLTVLRPFYDLSHEDLLSYCRSNDLQWIEDPSNDQEQYKRVRFRKAQVFLEEEGLTSERLFKTIERMGRARDALDVVVEDSLKRVVVESSEHSVSIDLLALYDLHFELRLRSLSKIIQCLTGNLGYPPRLEKLEALVADVQVNQPFRKRTFAGCVFEVKQKEKLFQITLENR